MNKKELYKQKIGIIKKVGGYEAWDIFSGVNRHGDEYRHFMVKSAIYELLSDKGHEVRTEVEIPNGWIADVIDATTAHIYEVETDLTHADKKRKMKRYLQAERIGPVIEDIIFLDPKKLPTDMFELREALEEELIF
ncbi:MAG: hypothetical protein ABEJ99_02575 [Candidatus Nanohaloarchaea archaeon]